MRIDLKCGEYLDFYKITRIEILDNDFVKIKGNLDKGQKSVLHKTRLSIIKNIREFNRFLKKEMKFYQVDGACECCGSLNVIEIGEALTVKKLNEPKEKMKIDKHTIARYKCKACMKVLLLYIKRLLYYSLLQVKAKWN